MGNLQMAGILLQQCIVIFLLFSIGVLIRKIGMITIPTARQLSSFVMLVVTPALVVMLLQRPYHPDMLAGMLTAGAGVIIFYLLAIPITRLIFKKKADGSDGIERLATISSNVGFVGIPLIAATIGPSGLLYVVIYIIFFNIHLWTLGVRMLRQERRIRWKEVFTCSVLIASVIGLVLFLGHITLPVTLRDTLNYLSSMNTPLPTILTGVFIGDQPLKAILLNKRVYLPCAVRLLGLPLLTILVFLAIRLPYWCVGGAEIALVLAICSACPSGMVAMMMPARLGMDATFGSNIIAQSNVLCILTVPLIAVIARTLFAI